jgi:hypothetical protein
LGNSPFTDEAGLTSLASIYSNLADWRDELYDFFASAPLFGDAIAERLLVAPDSTRGPIDSQSPKAFAYTPFRANKPGGVAFDAKSDQLRGDAVWLSMLQAGQAPMTGAELNPLSDPEVSAFLFEFSREWSAGEATPLVILREIAELVEDVLSGQLFRNIDFNALREEFEDYLLSLIPTKVRMGYGFDIHLGKEVAKATGGIFRPDPKTGLGIDMTIEIDLQPLTEGNHPKVDFKSVGTLGPFDVKLVGDFFDALTLSFASARFEGRAGEKSKFDIVFRDFRIGPKLKFVQKLQKYLAPKDGSGVIVRFDPTQPGVEAGYRLQLGDFAVGNLAFSNVGLEASAILPFSDEEAIFRTALSSRASPFTLTYAPYGGSGFFALLANVDGIIGFEASFEFGGSAVFAIGPLSGQGRLMSGVYIRQFRIGQTRVTEISMTFFVGGSASIWIFHFGAALSVKMGMVNGNMSGEATFSFSFSMGLADFEYSVVMLKEEGEGFSGQQQASLLGDHGKRFANLGEPGAPEHRSSNKHGARLISDAKCQSQAWNTFKSYFQDSAEPEGYF